MWKRAARIHLRFGAMAFVAIGGFGGAVFPAFADSPAESEAVSQEAAAPSLAEVGKTLADSIERLAGEYRALKTQAAEATESGAKAVAELQARDRLVEWMRTVEALVDNLAAQEDQGLDVRSLRQDVQKRLWSLTRRIPTFFEEVAAENSRMRSGLDDASAEALKAIEARIQGNEEILDETVRFYLSHIKSLDRLGFGSTRARTDAIATLGQRANTLSARLEIARQRLDEARKDNNDAHENEAAVHKAQEHLDHIAASLWTVCDVLDELDQPTAAYRRSIILATGELTTDVLDTAVMSELVDSAVETSKVWIEQRGPVLAGRAFRFIGVLLAFWILSRATKRLTARLATTSSQQMSRLAQQIVATTASRVVFAIGFFLALSQIGVNVTALLAGLGIVGFIVGFALQETLGNFAAGAMILIYDPFDVGDVIEAAGVTGTVDKMNLVSTTILTFDNQVLVIPNSRIWGNVIRNATAMTQRRVDLSFPLAVDADVEQAEKLFEEMCRDHPAVLDDPPLAIKVLEVSGAGVLVAVRPWVRTEDYWQTYWDLNREAHEKLQAAGIEIAAARYKLEERKAAKAE